MSQVNQPQTPRPASSDADFSCRAKTAGVRAAPTPQARHDFNAALDRARDHDDTPPRPDPNRTNGTPVRNPRSTDRDTDTDARDAFGPLGPLNPFATAAGALPAGAIAGAEALIGAAPTQVPVPTGPTGLAAESLAGHAIGSARQYNLGLPAEQGAALSLRLTQASASHWQLRLSTDPATRQQLAPHVERLRDRLRQRQGRHTADFELEDDSGA